MSDSRRLDRLIRTESLPVASGPTVVVHDSARSGWLTYETFYGMREKPFGLSSDPRFFYHSASHASAFEDLLAGIRRRESLSMLSGDIGTGKTTLCRTVLHCLDRQTFSAFVPDPFASREDLLKMILMEFGVISVDDLTSGRLNGASRTELSYLLYEFLGRLAPLQAFAVVVIDEAQNLSLSLLEEIRILSDSDGRERQLQIVLVGQLELQQKLTLPEMRQVEQRIPVRSTLGPLTRDGVAGYVAHRLHVAGGSPDRVGFSDDALDALYRASGGVPRLINRICDRALHHGHTRRAARIDSPIVETAVSDVGSDRTVSRATPPPPISIPPEAPPEPPAACEPSQECVDEWLTDVDAEVAKTSAVHHKDDPVLAAHSGDPAFLLAVARSQEEGWDAWTGSVPRTLLQRTLRRWLRRLWVAGLRALGLSAGVLLAAFLWSASTERDEPTEPAPPPAPLFSLAPALRPAQRPEGPLPELAEAGSHLIQVTLFQSQARADRVVAALARDGYPAHRAIVDLGARGLRQQVLAGPYATLAEAELDLERLHTTPDYRDARVVPVSPRPDKQ